MHLKSYISLLDTPTSLIYRGKDISVRDLNALSVIHRCLVIKGSLGWSSMRGEGELIACGHVKHDPEGALIKFGKAFERAARPAGGAGCFIPTRNNRDPRRETYRTPHKKPGPSLSRVGGWVGGCLGGSSSAFQTVF